MGKPAFAFSSSYVFVLLYFHEKPPNSSRAIKNVLFLSSLSNSIARFPKKKFTHYRGKIEEEERVSFRSFTYFYIPRSIPRAKLSTAVDISRYEWAATPTIFPSSCYAVSFFDGSPAHAIYLSREGEGEEPTSK